MTRERLNSPNENGSVGGIGTGWNIGDNVVLTAGHVVYEANEEDNRIARAAVTLSSTEVFIDLREYLTAFETRFRQLSDPLPTLTNADIRAGLTVSSKYIEPHSSVSSKDTIVIKGSDDVDSGNAGLAVYIDPSVLGGVDFGLTSSTILERDGRITRRDNGTVESVGSGSYVFSEKSLEGDSGGAHLLTMEQKSFVIGNTIARTGPSHPDGPNHTIASLFTLSEFYRINSFLENAVDENGNRLQTGNVTDGEPTNLIIGREIADGFITGSGTVLATEGTFRADIILGRGGDDVLSDGDVAREEDEDDDGNPIPSTVGLTWADDQLFGGAGDDYLIAGAGNDLLHGGDFREYDGDRAELATDGVDTVDFKENSTGIEIRLPTSLAEKDDTYQDVLGTDFTRAFTVSSKEDSAAGQEAAQNTLVSIEKLKGTEKEDTLFIASLGDDFLALLADANTGQGGIAEIDLAGDPENFLFEGADGINLSNVDLDGDQGVTIDLRNAADQKILGADGSEVPLKLSNIENIVGTKDNDTLYAKNVENILGPLTLPIGSLVAGGEGNDIIYGGSGSDYLAGGADDDTIHLGSLDVAVGGEGRDTFVITSSDSFMNSVTILDFNPDEDIILIDGNAPEGFSKTTTTVDFARIDSESREFKIQKTTGISPFGLIPLVPRNVGNLPDEDEEFQPYQNGQYRDIVVGAFQGVANSGRITYVDADLSWGDTRRLNFSEQSLDLSIGAAQGVLSSVSLNSFVSIFFGDSGGYDQSLFQHSLEGLDPTRDNPRKNVASNDIVTGRIIEQGEDDESSLNLTGFEADGLSTSSGHRSGDPTSSFPLTYLHRLAVNVSAPPAGAAPFAAFGATFAANSASASFTELPDYALSNGAHVDIRPDISSLFVSSSGGVFADIPIGFEEARAFDVALGIKDSGFVGVGTDFNLRVAGLSTESAGNFRLADDAGGDLSGTDGSDFLLGSDASDNLSATQTDVLQATGLPVTTDLLVGGLGDDSYNANIETGRVVVAEGIAGVNSGGGQDTVVASFSSTSLQLSATEDNQNLVLSSNDGTNVSEIVIFGQLDSDSSKWVEEVQFSDGQTQTRDQLLSQLGILPVQIANVEVAEDTAVDFNVPEGGFNDPQNRELMISASLSNSDPLPSWLTYSNGTFSGTPPANFNGQLEVQLTATAGSDTATANFILDILPVNDAPAVSNPVLDLVSAINMAVDFAIPSNTFTDVDGDALTFFATLSSGDPLPIWLSFDGERFTGTPPQDFEGTVAISVVAADDDFDVADDFILTIGEVSNNAPTVSIALADQNSDEDQAIDILLPSDAFTDPDGDALTLSATLAVGNALPTWLTFDGERFTGQPPQDFNGALALAVTASDGELNVSQNFNLTIDPINDAPVLAAMISDQVSLEDQAIDFAIPVGTFADVDGDVLALSATLVDGSDLPAWLNFDGTSFTGQPPQDFNGVIDIELTASDGEFEASDLFALSISPVNDPPVVLTPLMDISSNEDIAVDIAIPTDTFSDVDGDILTLAATFSDGSDLPAWLTFDGSRLTGTPPQDFNGDIDIAITASDGELDIVDHFTLTIDPVNDAPVVLNSISDANSAEDAMVNIALPSNVFRDVDGDALALTASLADGSDLPAWLSFDGVRFTGTPPLDFNGSIDIQVIADDGALQVSNDFSLTIDAVNDAPVIATVLSDQNSDEDSTVSFALPAGAFADVDGDTLQLTATLSDGSDLPTWLSFDGSSFKGTPPNNFNGSLSLAVTASDGEFTASQNFNLNIDPVNDAPEILNLLADQNLLEDTAFDIVVPADTFADVDGDTLSLTATLADGSDLPAWIEFDGQRITGTPPQDFNGALDIRVTASDGQLTVNGDFTLTVDPQNDAPTLAQVLPDVESNEDTAFSIALPQDAFVDADGDVLTLSAQLVDGNQLPDWITFDGQQFTGTPPQDFNGFVDIEVTASDGSLEASDSFLFTIDPVNDAPIAVNDDIFLSEGGDELTIQQSSLLDNDSDIDGDTLSVVSVSDGANGTVGFDADGNVVYTPNAGFEGEDSFSYTVSDGELTSSATVQLRVDNPYSGWRQGTEGNDYLFGNFFRTNEIFGRGGNDWIFGGFRQDYLAGGDGNDRIFGLFGNDHLWGNAGDDLLFGGFGTDTAYFSGNSSDYELQTQSGGFYVRVRDELPGVDGDDGRDQLFSIERLAFANETISVSSPIILDLDGNGTRFVSAAESDATFDLDGDGVRDDTAWISSGDAFLFLDRDGSGFVSGANEISFVDDVEDALSDLDGLRSFDSNSDGLLSADDDRFGEFGVWQDLDTDGEVDAGETFTLDQAGIESINLNATPTEAGFSLGGVAVANQGIFNRTDGTSGSFADAAITFFEQGTPKLPKIDFVGQTYDPTSSKYRVHAVGGELMIGSKRNAETALAGASILTIGKRTRGYLTPIILDLDGDGIEMRRWKKSRAKFDMDGDGSRDNVGWTGKGDGFLVIDRNNNGIVDNGSELSFLVENPNAKSDLQALSALDSNGDGIVSSLDVRFRELKVWVDADDNGVTDPGELRTLEDHGIASVDLAGQATNERVKFGQNILLATSFFTRTDGTTGQVGDAALAFKPAGASTTASTQASQDAAPNSTSNGSGELSALGTGLQDTQPSHAEQGLQINVPEGVNAFDYFDQNASTTSNDDTLGTSDALDVDAHMLPVEHQGGPAPIDPDVLKLAIMTQDMNSFGASSGATAINERERAMTQLDYFAA